MKYDGNINNTSLAFMLRERLVEIREKEDVLDRLIEDCLVFLKSYNDIVVPFGNAPFQQLEEYNVVLRRLKENAEGLKLLNEKKCELEESLDKVTTHISHFDLSKKERKKALFETQILTTGRDDNMREWYKRKMWKLYETEIRRGNL